MAEKITVKRHVRRRTGRTAQVAASLGFPTTVNVREFSRRRPVMSESYYAGGQWKQMMPGMYQREYSRVYPHGRIYGNVFKNPQGKYTWALYYEEGDTIAFGTTETLKEAKVETTRAYNVWIESQYAPETPPELA